MPWEVDGYVASLTAASPHTREAYARDVRQFVDWAERGGCPIPDVARSRDAAPLPRVPQHAAAREAHDRAQGRVAAVVPPVPQAARRRRRRTPVGRCGRRRVRPGSRASRTRRRPSRSSTGWQAERAGRRRRRPAPWPGATSPSSRSSTEPACGSPSAAGSRLGTATWPGERSPSSARGPRSGGCRSAARPAEALDDWLREGRPAGRRTRQPARRRLPQPAGPAPVAPGRAAHPGAVSAARWAHLAPTRPPARLRYAPARRRCRPACRAGAPRPRRPRDHPDLHPPHPRAPPGGLRGNPSPCLTTPPPSPPRPTPPRSSPSSGATTRRAAPRTRASA